MTARAEDSAGARSLLMGAALALLWLPCWTTLSAQWSANAQYSFGWLTPLLALYLGYARWLNRPPAEAMGRNERASYAWLLLASLAIFVPTWLLLQPSPDWRLLHWSIAGIAVVSTLSIAALTGGSSWFRHFAAPVCLVLFAVPWPSGWEARVIGSLMQLVAELSVAVLNFLGTPAARQGNLIEIGTGLLGVDEACSGVRSLQATLMATFAFGELYRLSFPRRITVIAAGVGIAIATNVVRATLLGWIAAHQGLATVNQWHDPAGMGVMTSCFVLAWAVSWWLARQGDDASYNSAPAAASIRTASSLPRWNAMAVLVVVAGTLVWTEVWFRSGGNESPQAQWDFRWPTDGINPREVKIAALAAEMLRYDHGRALAWSDSAGDRWLAYDFQWKPGPARSRILARMHHPEYCLPSSGWRPEEELQPVTLNLGEDRISFRHMRFSHADQAINVWFSSVEIGRNGSTSAIEEPAQVAAIRAVVNRERALAQRVLEIVRISAATDRPPEQAFDAEIRPRFQRTVPK